MHTPLPPSLRPAGPTARLRRAGHTSGSSPREDAAAARGAAPSGGSAAAVSWSDGELAHQALSIRASFGHDDHLGVKRPTRFAEGGGVVPGTLGSKLAEQDGRRFVGREAELEWLMSLLSDDPRRQVALVHGPAGIGKTALSRAFGGEARRLGWHVAWVDVRGLDTGGDALAGALAGVADHERAVAVIDAVDAGTGVEATLREGVALRLPQHVRYVLMGRDAPDEGWRQPLWNWRTGARELTPLDETDSHTLLEAHGVVDRSMVSTLTAWAAGIPLILVEGAEAARQDRSWNPGFEPMPELLARRLVRGIVGDPDGFEHPEVLALAAEARVVSEELVAGCLPVGGSGELYRWLASRSYVEPRTFGVGLPEHLRRALRAEFRRGAPALQRELGRKVADHLHARAVQGKPRTAIDLADMVQSHGLRATFSWTTASCRIDMVRDEDIAALEQHFAASGNTPWWTETLRWFAEGRESVRVARDREGALRGYTIVVAPDAAPSWASDDPIVGPCLEAARGTGSEAVIWRESVDLRRPPDATLSCVGMLNVAGLLATGVANPRWGYIAETPVHSPAERVGTVLGGVREPRLDAVVGGVPVRCWVVDFGMGGLLGGQRDAVYRELGFVPPGGQPRSPEVQITAALVRDALRAYQNPRELALSELALGPTRELRAASVRELLERAVAGAFGAEEREVLMRRVVEVAYLSPDTSRRDAAADLGISRSTLFRVATEAIERIAAFLAAEQEGG